MIDARPTSKRLRRVTFTTTEKNEMKTTSYESSLNRTSMVDHILWWPKMQRFENKKDAFMQAACARGSFTEDGNYTRSTYSKMLARVYQANLKGKELPPHLQTEFFVEVSQRHSVRGLEKLIVDGIKDDRIQRREKVIAGVLYIQRRCYKEGKPDHLRMNMIRLASQSLTESAHRMAKMYGDADQFAAQYYEAPTTAMKKVSASSLTADVTPISGWLPPTRQKQCGVTPAA